MITDLRLCIRAVFLASALAPALAHGQQVSASPPFIQGLPDQFEAPARISAAEPPVSLKLSYDSDINADVSGGSRRGVAYLGKLAAIADADLDRLIGLPTAKAHISVLDIHGTGLSSSRVNNLMTVSGLEADPAIRLNQVWVSFHVNKAIRVKLGKFPSSPEFMTSNTAGFFVNATFGWPTSFATDLPQGGPSFPLSAPGALTGIALSSRLALTMAVFAGTPAGRSDGDPQKIDGHGFGAFRMTGKPLTVAELAYQASDSAMIKLGAWRHFGNFARLGPLGPKESQFSGNWSAYALVDARIAGGAKAARQLHVFARASAAPDDRNPVSIYADTGAQLTAPLAGRDNDAIGLAFAVSHISSRITRPGAPHAEHLVELSYSAAVTQWLNLQPNLQAILDPVDPDTFTARRGTAMILGLRTSVTM